MEKSWPHVHVPRVLLSVVSSSKAKDGAHGEQTTSGALFLSLGVVTKCPDSRPSILNLSDYEASSLPSQL